MGGYGRRSGNINSIMVAILRISIVVPVAVQVLRTPIPHQSRFAVVVTRDKVVVGRRRPSKRNQRPSQGPSPSQDAACLNG